MSVVESEATFLRGPIEVDHSQPTGRLRRRGSRSDTGVPATEMPGARALAAMAEAARRAQEGPTATPPGQTARVPKSGLARRDRRWVRASDGLSPVGSEGAATPSLGSTVEANGDTGVVPSPKTGASAGCSRRCWSRPRWSWSRASPWPSFWAPIRMSSPRFILPAPPCRPVTRPPPIRGRAVPHGPGRGQRDREPPCRARPRREPHRFSRRSVRQRGGPASR